MYLILNHFLSIFCFVRIHYSMGKILKFNNNLDYYLKLYDTRKIDNDLLGALDAARSALTRAKTRIDREAINLLLGQVYYDMGLFALSCEYYFRAIKTPFSRAGAYFGIGRSLVMMDKLLLALEYFDAVLAWDYKDEFTDAVLEWSEVIKNKLKKAESTNLNKKIKTNIAGIFRIKKYNEAESYLSQLVELYPNDPDYNILLVQCYFYQKKFDDARRVLFDILRLFPENINALVMSCQLCIYVEDYSSLDEYLHLLSKLEITEQGQMLSIGNIYFNLGRYNIASQYFEQALSNNEYKPKLLLYIAICYYNQGDYENSLFYVARARWIDFESPTLVQFYNLFREQQYSEHLGLSDRLPDAVVAQKYELVKSYLENENFGQEFLRSNTMLDDLEWSLTLSEFEINQLLSMRLTSIKHKKAINMVSKILLSTRPTIKQKFLFTKYALQSGNYKYIDLTANYKFRSFSTKMQKALFNNELVRNAISSARAYVECYATGVDILSELHELSRAVIRKGNDIKIDENTLACAYFYQKSQVLFDACIYFGVDVGTVNLVLRELGINN